MGKKKVTSTQVSSVIDHETGEIIREVHTKTFAIEREPDYIKLYIRDVGRLKDIAPGKDKILYYLVKTMTYNNIIAAYAPLKNMWCRDLGISKNYLNKAIDEFYKKGIFIRIARGIYMADPELFAKGKWEDIKNLRMVIDYSSSGKRTLKSNIGEEMQLKLGL